MLWKYGGNKMVSNNRRCSECKGEMFLDHVSIVDNVRTLYYACVNPNCKERGKSYSLNGAEAESQIKDKE